MPGVGRVTGSIDDGIAALERGDPTSAEALLQRVTRDDPQNHDAWLFLGIARNELGDTRGALEAFTTCTRLRPEAPHGWTNLGITHARRNDLLEAARHLVKARTIDPSDLTTRLNIGLVFYKLRNKMLEALGEFEHVLDADPSLADAWHHLGMVFMEFQQKTHALFCFEKARALGFDDEKNARLARGLKFEGVSPEDPFDPAAREAAFNPFRKDIATRREP